MLPLLALDLDIIVPRASIKLDHDNTYLKYLFTAIAIPRKPSELIVPREHKLFLPWSTTSHCSYLKTIYW
jgi:hypothetical protein